MCLRQVLALLEARSIRRLARKAHGGWRGLVLARGLKRRQGRVVEAEFKEKLGGDGVMTSPENRL